MRTISDEDIPNNVNYQAVIMEMRRQFLMVAGGTSKILHRKRISSMSGTLDVMGALSEEDKIGVVKHYFYGKNIDFLVSLFSTETSEILLAITGKKFTRIRTATATGLATDLLSRKDSRLLACIGTGFQALEQIRAICQIRSIDQVLINDLNTARMKSLKSVIEQELGIDVVLQDKVSSNFSKADIIVTATTSKTPVIADQFIGDRTHIISIGSYLPEMKEIETQTICKSKIVAVDSLEETENSVGELIDSLSSGCVSKEQINEFTNLVKGEIKLRENAQRSTTYFKSIGVGIEDLTVAKMFYEGTLL
jgi:ornithine cyclodeaminase/alanine dehydrogenase-like protein (mu-crystallin family)